MVHYTTTKNLGYAASEPDVGGDEDGGHRGGAHGSCRCTEYVMHVFRSCVVLWLVQVERKNS